MYLKHIAIKHIGPIEELSVELPFKENGDPKPVIFVGENGSGKTILQSQIIDGFYEIGGALFDDIKKQQGLGYQYYKISGGINLQTGKEKGFSLLSFIDDENKKIEYFDRIKEATKDDFTQLVPDFSLAPNDKDHKKVTNIDEIWKEKLQKEWEIGAHFYQPAYRYEEPFWKNESFVDEIRFEDKKRFTGKLNKEIEIISATKDNKAYLLDLVLDFEIQKNPLDQITWNNINLILRSIKQKSDIRFGIGPRGRYRVSIVEESNDGKTIKQLLPSIDNLSLGESLLLNLFINIIRHGDNPPKLTNQIKGIVAIDEIDVHLHTDLQNSVLPNLIKMFPKIQFIITTHSPLFLLGMKNTFGDENFEIRNMPHGEIITTERFSEFENAYKILKETEKFENDIKQQTEKLTKPALFVEGDYDVKYITKASEFLDKKDILEKIQIFDANGFGGLDKIWKHYNSKLSEIVPQKTLLLYDCDTNKEDNQKGDIFKRTIPTKEEMFITKGIENLFEKNTLTRAIKHKKAFIDITPAITKTIRGIDTTIPEKYEINTDEKRNFCNRACENGTKEDFKNFDEIFTILENTIIQTENKE